MSTYYRRLLFIFGSIFFVAGFAHSDALPEYRAVAGISGNLNSMGSDSLNNLLTLWGEAFQRYYPAVNIQIQGTGSSVAPIALLEGTANLGPMSREMNAAEKEEFAIKYGYYPTAIPVAVDVIAVYVNKDNPLQAISMQQLDAVFSVSRRCGAVEKIHSWGDLGLTGKWMQRDFERYSRHAVSGTYGYFKKSALCSGDFKTEINEMPGSASVVNGVAGSLNGIGYAGIGFKSAGVKVLAIQQSGEQIVANSDNVSSGKYPLVRTLYLYINRPPGEAVSPVESEFLKMVLTDDGQQIIRRAGYLTLPAGRILELRQALQIE